MSSTMKRGRRTLAVTMTVSALAGARPASAQTAQPEQALPTTSVPPLARRVRFDEAIRRALEANPTARVAAEEIRHAEALMEQARAASLPTLNATGTYMRLDNDRVQPGTSTVVLAKDSLNLNALLTVPIVSPKAWAQWRHAKENIDVARASGADVRRILGLSVGRAYLAVIAEKRLLETSLRARDTAKAHFDYAHSRLMGGVGNRIDEVRAAQQLASDEAAVESAKVALLRAREALGVFLGIEEPIDNADDVTPETMPTLDAAMTDAQQKRSDVVAGQRRVDAAAHVRKDDWTDLSPYLVGTFMPFYQNPPTTTLPQTGWQAQLVLTLPLYDGGLRYGQWHEREVLEEEARTSLEGLARQARSDVRTAFEALKSADDALKSARDAARLAAEALALANLAYRAGATTNLEVIDAERQARDAETQAAIAEDVARNARLDLLSASGRFP
jgi:outer membrane protein TolC